MATKTCTCGAAAFKFEDPSGIEHVVTTNQTFTFELTDGGAAAVTYAQDNATSVTTTDGRRLTFRPQVTISQPGATAFNGNRLTWGPTADAQNGVAVYSLAGEFVTEFSEGNIPQYWKAITITANDVDAPTQLDGTFEDQFGRKMTWVAISVA